MLRARHEFHYMPVGEMSMKVCSVDSVPTSSVLGREVFRVWCTLARIYCGARLLLCMMGMANDASYIAVAGAVLLQRYACCRGVELQGHGMPFHHKINTGRVWCSETCYAAPTLDKLVGCVLCVICVSISSKHLLVRDWCPDNVCTANWLV
jgi:hypothetical protein